MTEKQIKDLLHSIECLRQPCDLDLMLFFYRHPRAYLISERLAQYVGYDLQQVTQSLENLITAGLLRRSPDSTHPALARLYVLKSGSPVGNSLSSLLRFAVTREGRLAVIGALKEQRLRGLSGGAEADPTVRGIPRSQKVPYA